MPKEVSVSTAEPGSSASTLAYRAAQRELSCGPSSKGVITAVGPTDRMTSATLSIWARSSHTRETRTISSPSSTNCTIRRVHPSLPTSGCGGEGRLPGGTDKSVLHRATIDGVCFVGCETTAHQSSFPTDHLFQVLS